VLNTGGYAPPQALDARAGQYEMIFGRWPRTAPTSSRAAPMTTDS